MGRPLKIVSNAWLSSGSRYLFADPGIAPALVRTRLARSNPGPSVESRRVKDYEGQGLRILHDVGITAANQVGVVRLAS